MRKMGIRYINIYIYIYVYKFLRSKNMHTKADVVVYVDLRHVAFAI